LPLGLSEALNLKQAELPLPTLPILLPSRLQILLSFLPLAKSPRLWDRVSLLLLERRTLSDQTQSKMRVQIRIEIKTKINL